MNYTIYTKVRPISLKNIDFAPVYLHICRTKEINGMIDEKSMQIFRIPFLIHRYILISDIFRGRAHI